VEAGAVRLACGSSEATFCAGTMLLMPPAAAGRLLLTPAARLAGCSFGRSLLDPLALDGSGEAVVEALGLARSGGQAAAPTSARLQASEQREASSLLSLLERESRERRPGFQTMVRLRLMEALLLLYRAHRRHADGAGDAATDGGPAPTRLPFRVDEVKRFLQERYSDSLTLDGIAARYGFNPSYFSRLFHREAGVPLVGYINGVRIQHSCQLLKRTGMSVLEIALSVGYNNVSHFNRYFRRTMGMSPREYRTRSVLADGSTGNAPGE
jgi:AraC-like DNA-binding protein